MSNTVWKCEQWRAGQVLSRMMFYSKEEAENFCAEMGKREPDIFWRMEPIEAKMVWN